MCFKLNKIRINIQTFVKQQTYKFHQDNHSQHPKKHPITQTDYKIQRNHMKLLIYFYCFKQFDNYQTMLIKFIKAEVKHPNLQGKYINIQIYENQKKFAIRSPRKIKQKVANFYNQTIDLTVSKTSIKFYIYVLQLNNQLFNSIHFQYIIPQNTNSTSPFQPTQKQNRNMLYQNQMLRLFWAWQFQVLNSRKNSQYSLGTFNKQLAYGIKQQQNNLMLYSKNIKKHNFLWLKDQAISQNGQNKILRNIQKITKRLPTQQNCNKYLVRQDGKKSKSAQTRSKTIQSSNNLLKKSLPLPFKNNTNKSLIVLDGENRVNNKPNNPIHRTRNSKKHNRRYSLNINKVGAAVAGAVGIFVGLLAGYVQH